MFPGQRSCPSPEKSNGGIRFFWLISLVTDWDERKTTFFRTYACPVEIGNNVWIGGGSILLPGVTIGENSVIGAGSVVNRSIPANCVAVGNPCRVIRCFSADEERRKNNEKWLEET